MGEWQRKFCVTAEMMYSDNLTEAHNSKLTTRNLKRKSAVEEQEQRQQGEMDEQTSGNLESIAESSRWEEESDADSLPGPKRRSETSDCMNL